MWQLAALADVVVGVGVGMSMVMAGGDGVVVVVGCEGGSHCQWWWSLQKNQVSEWSLKEQKWNAKMDVKMIIFQFILISILKFIL